MSEKPIFRTLCFDLALTPEQQDQSEQFAGVVRLVYNLALAQRRDFWRQYRRTQGRSISFASQSREVTALRAEFDWVARVPVVATTAAQTLETIIDVLESNYSLWRHEIERAMDLAGHLTCILPMAKGYARDNPVGRNAEMIAAAEAILNTEGQFAEGAHRSTPELHAETAKNSEGRDDG